MLTEAHEGRFPLFEAPRLFYDTLEPKGPGVCWRRFPALRMRGGARRPGTLTLLIAALVIILVGWQILRFVF